jgi:flagellar basal-body rod modification protein FlgD
MSSITSTSTDLKTDFMTLLVNQLRYQNPLEPMDNTEMTSQLAQISQLQQMEEINSFSEQLLQATQRAEAADLIGKQIAYVPEGDDTATPVLATVEGVDFSSGSVNVIAGGKSVAMDSIMGIAGS